jgi:peptidoglycan/xylan/chitin deacetylase (PgdA/CDA1 family)
MGTANGNTVSAVVARVVAARTPGEIVLMHLGANPNDQSTLDAAALPAIIDRLRYYGYSFVTLYPLLH